jgi:glycosyltransferase involved in cell wall biosynthesis
MKLSIFTPTHGESKWLPELWETIKNQTYQDFEWIIVKNNGGVVPFEDPRIKVFEIDNPEKSIGKVKRYACSQATGDILVEIDHDDLITEDCLEEVAKAFEDPEISFAYSNCADFHYDGTDKWEPNTYGEYYGWQARDFEWHGHKLKETLSFEPVPSSFQMIWYAPNHIRAWRTKDYFAVGGHDPNLEAVDDFDLELRTYLYGKMKHIDKCLYLYRIHGKNQWIEKNQYIQRVAQEKADEYFYRMAYRWAELNNWSTINIEDIEGDLNERWPLEDNSIGVIRAWDRLQLLDNPQHAMNEIYRILKPGGYLLSSTPSTDGRGAFQNPNHKSFWNENSFYYYIDASESPKINNKTRFQAVRHRTYFPDQTHQNRNIPFVMFDAIAVKDGIDRLPGGIHI